MIGQNLTSTDFLQIHSRLRYRPIELIRHVRNQFKLEKVKPEHAKFSDMSGSIPRIHL